jgi:hypothetical protein
VARNVCCRLRPTFLGFCRMTISMLIALHVPSILLRDLRVFDGEERFGCDRAQGDPMNDPSDQDGFQHQHTVWRLRQLLCKVNRRDTLDGSHRLAVHFPRSRLVETFHVDLHLVENGLDGSCDRPVVLLLWQVLLPPSHARGHREVLHLLIVGRMLVPHRRSRCSTLLSSVSSK